MRFDRLLTSGRTVPGLFGCEDESGRNVGEYVVKLSGCMETGTTGLMLELIGSKLASHFGVLTPEPAIIEVSKSLVTAISRTNPQLAPHISKGEGLNFGTKHLTNVSTWPVGQPIPKAMLQGAARIFAFDALIDNQDRRYANPNLLARGDDIFVFDHEDAFRFLRLTGSRDKPWDLNKRRALDDHVFYLPLKRREIDLTDFSLALVGLSETVFGEVASTIPPQWSNDNLSRISAHLQAMRDHAGEFAEQVRRRLA